MAHTFTKPPLVEAICELRFLSSQPWDSTIPGLFYLHIQSDFPTIEQALAIQVTWDLQGGQATQQPEPRTRFLTADRSEVIQIGPNVLSIHQLQAYHSWAQFKARIFSTLQAYRQILRKEASLALNHLVLRYINRVELPSDRAILDGYLKALPRIPEPIPQSLQSFLVQLAIPYTDPNSLLRFNFGSLFPEQSDQKAFILDLEMFSPNDVRIEIDSVNDWLEVAHSRIWDAFYASFTPKTHIELFGEDIK